MFTDIGHWFATKKHTCVRVNTCTVVPLYDIRDKL